MRRTHLRGHRNILKRLLVHAGGFNLALIMRQLVGAGTPRGLRARLWALCTLLAAAMGHRWPSLETPAASSVPGWSYTNDALSEVALA